MRQRTEITWETEETIIVKRGVTFMRTFCPLCRSNVEMISTEIFASLGGAHEREVFRLIEAGKVYFIELDRTLACVGCYRSNIASEIPSQIICEENKPTEIIRRSKKEK